MLKNWDTQRIGTSLKIVKIIILSNPKNWTILRKRKSIRDFSNPKNWDGVFGGPKVMKNVPDFACLQALSTCPRSLVNQGDIAKTTPLL